jgi:hypothetical protein
MPTKPVTVRLPSGVYEFRDSPDPLTDANGESCDTLPDDQDKIIWVSPTVRPQDRLQLFLDVASEMRTRQDRMVPVVA